MKKQNYIVPFVIVLICVYLFIAVSVSARTHETAVNLEHAHFDLIKKLDLDKDGQITIKEAVAEPALLAVFGQLDTDANGKINRLELSKLRDAKTTLVKSIKGE